MEGSMMEKFEYTPEIIRKIQLTELSILRELDRICQKCKIPYIIDSGTLLGAVRHEGFIPWDDDIDIKMLRRDYDKFCNICKDELGKKYFLQTYRTDKGYRWGYARILRKGTVFIRAGHQSLKSKTGIFIDVFPCDNMPEGKAALFLCNALSLVCRKMLYSEVGAKSAPFFVKRIGFACLDLLPKEWAYYGLEKIADYCGRKETGKVRCYAWGSKEETVGQKREWFENTCDICFEGLMVKAPAKKEEVLTYYYGKDYMTPPPEEERQPKHTAEYIKFVEEDEGDVCG